MKRFFVTIMLLVTLATLQAQMTTNGRVEVVYIDAQDGAPAESSKNFINQGNPTFLWRFRGYLDMQVSERSSIFTDFRLQPNGLELDFAAVRLLFNDKGTAGIQAGVLGTLIGNVTARRSSKYNPMIQLPIMYDYFTAVQDNAYLETTGLVQTRGKGAGLRILHLGVYSPGAELFFTFAEKVDLNLALYNSAPSNPYMVNEARQLNYAGRIGLRPFLGLNVGLSLSHGPYMGDHGNRSIDLKDTMQRMIDLDFSFERGHFSLFGEVVRNSWRLPKVENDLSVSGYYVEPKYKFHPRWYGAVRIGQLFFDKLDNGEPWDDDIFRTEFSIGYYVERETLAKLVIQRNRTDRIDPDDDYVALQLSAGF